MLWQVRSYTNLRNSSWVVQVLLTYHKWPNTEPIKHSTQDILFTSNFKKLIDLVLMFLVLNQPCISCFKHSCNHQSNGYSLICNFYLCKSSQDLSAIHKPDQVLCKWTWDEACCLMNLPPKTKPLDLVQNICNQIKCTLSNKFNGFESNAGNNPIDLTRHACSCDWGLARWS